MAEQLLKATHQGELNIVDINIPCAVLEDGTRILRERSVANSLGYKGSGAHWKRKKRINGGAVLPEFVSAKNLEPFITDEVRSMLIIPISYKTKTGGKARGISAKVLPEICNIWLKAREKSALTEKQLETAKKAEILMRGLAHVGIIALVDEATGYQDDRAKAALAEILEKFIAKELQEWTKTFPDTFYKEMFRLKQWTYDPTTVKRPSVIGRYTNDIVYERLAPDVLDQLKARTPRTRGGHRRYRYFQWLTGDIGHPKLREHISNVIVMMKLSSNWRSFLSKMNRILPKLNKPYEMPLDYEDEE